MFPMIPPRPLFDLATLVVTAAAAALLTRAAAMPTVVIQLRSGDRPNGDRSSA